MIGGDNAALSTDGILAGSEGIVRRDIAAFASADSRAASAVLDIAQRALVSNGLARHRQVAAAGILYIRQRQSILNLGMLLSTECNVRVNLRSMARAISAITLAG
ncbi:hypothetical protein CQ10_07940 [Bradyrhizobium valentinum]|uniref:Uncharacterized protein n=1 Tax=Bradyrhizobium valentinum TaxID=1518501 RepID=A0A0R3KD84_9BRAD|nr:hypothetical protein CQ10_07940 [Bradyrhizobium valentinum]KRQ96728.1 hypothetical protein CP49_27710 [Bradyrhizobium valentinum]